MAYCCSLLTVEMGSRLAVSQQVMTPSFVGVSLGFVIDFNLLFLFAHYCYIYMICFLSSITNRSISIRFYIVSQLALRSSIFVTVNSYSTQRKASSCSQLSSKGFKLFTVKYSISWRSHNLFTSRCCSTSAITSQ